MPIQPLLRLYFSRESLLLHFDGNSLAQQGI
jgi:hypothetical protein